MARKSSLFSYFFVVNSRKRAKPVWGLRQIFLMPFLAFFVLLPVCSSSKPMKFATQPSDQTAVLGSTVVLPCRVISKTATVQWTRDGFGLGTIRRLQGFDRYSMIGSDEEGDFSLRISPVTLEDDSIYQCQVASRGGPKLRSRIARLTVFVPPKPPTVNTSPEVEATAGVNVSITCRSIGGRPAPEIQWIDETGGQEFREGIVYSEELMEDGLRLRASSVLTFAPSRLHHLRTLTCLTHNPALNEPLAARVVLRVRFPPEIELHHNPEELSEGTEAKVSCEAEANPNNIKYKWLRGGKSVPGVEGPTLNLGVLSKKDHGTSIACEATNSVGTIRRTKTLDVKFAPRFKTAPESKSADPDSQIFLRCDVEGNPEPKITWQHVETNKIVGNGVKLKLRASEETAGTYVCVAVSRGYSPLEGRLHLRLRGPPVISASRNVAARKGQMAELRCQVKAVPHPLAVTWMKNGATINPDSNGRVRISEKQKADGILSLLIINATEENDFAPYNCSVVNEYGIDIKQIVLRKEATIPIIFIVGGGFGVVVIVVIAIIFIIYGRKPTPPRKPEKSVETGNGTDGSPHHNATTASSPKSANQSAITSNDVTVLPSILNHDHSTASIRPKNDLRISDNDSDRKEMDNRTGSSLSAVERESDKWDGSDKSLGTIPRSALQYQRYQQPAAIGSQNQAYLTYPEYSWSYSPVASAVESSNPYSMAVPYTYATTRSSPAHDVPNSAAPPPYSPTPNGGLVGVNGLTSRLNGLQNGRISNGVTTVVSSGALRHDLIADLQQPDLTRDSGVIGRTDIHMREDPHTKDNSTFHSKFILPPQANFKPGTLV